MPIHGDKYPFTEANVNKSPEERGVYQLLDGDVIIYYGRAAGDGVTIRSRLQSHRNGSEGKCTQVRHITGVKSPIAQLVARKNYLKSTRRTLVASHVATGWLANFQLP